MNLLYSTHSIIVLMKQVGCILLGWNSVLEELKEFQGLALSIKTV